MKKTSNTRRQGRSNLYQLKSNPRLTPQPQDSQQSYSQENQSSSEVSLSTLRTPSSLSLKEDKAHRTDLAFLGPDSGQTQSLDSGRRHTVLRTYLTEEEDRDQQDQEPQVVEAPPLHLYRVGEGARRPLSDGSLPRRPGRLRGSLRDKTPLEKANLSSSRLFPNTQGNVGKRRENSWQNASSPSENMPGTSRKHAQGLGIRDSHSILLQKQKSRKYSHSAPMTRSTGHRSTLRTSATTPGRSGHNSHTGRNSNRHSSSSSAQWTRAERPRGNYKRSNKGKRKLQNTRVFSEISPPRRPGMTKQKLLGIEERWLKEYSMLWRRLPLYLTIMKNFSTGRSPSEKTWNSIARAEATSDPGIIEGNPIEEVVVTSLQAIGNREEIAEAPLATLVEAVNQTAYHLRRLIGVARIMYASNVESQDILAGIVEYATQTTPETALKLVKMMAHIRVDRERQVQEWEEAMRTGIVNPNSPFSICLEQPGVAAMIGPGTRTLRIFEIDPSLADSE